MSVTDNSLTDAAGDFLGRKYGPLPLGAWLVIAGGTAFFVKKYINNRDAANVQVGTDSTPNAADLTMGSSPAYSMPATSSPAAGGGYATGSGTSGSYSDTTVTPDIPQSNAEWQSRGVGILVGLGYDAYQATLALQTYLAGKVLSSDQRAMVTAVVKALGAPPETVAQQANTPTGSQPIESQITISVGSFSAFGRAMPLNVRWVSASGGNLTGILGVQVWNGKTGNWVDTSRISVVNGVGRIAAWIPTKTNNRLRVITEGVKYKPAISNVVEVKG